MKAPWKQTPLEQAQKRSPALDKEKQIADLKAEIAKLKRQAHEVAVANDALNDACGRWRATADEYENDRDRYQTLRNLDVMIMDKDGAKYLKGAELDKYIDEYHGIKLQASVYNNINKRYLKALSAAMAQTKQSVAANVIKHKYVHSTYPMGFTLTEIDYGLDARSSSQEEDQGNP